MTIRSNGGYIGPGLRIRGMLSGEGDLVIDGRFEGDVKVEGTIEIGVEGSVAAPVQARSIVVHGLLEGTVRANGGVAIHPGGRVVGDVHAGSVSLSDGAILDGSVIMEFDLPDDFSESA